LRSCNPATEKYKEFGLALGSQAVVTGPANAPEKSFVVIDNVIYEVNSPSAAFDIAFKAKFALHAVLECDFGHL